MTDIELIQKIIRREPDAFDALCGKYARVLYSFTLRIVKARAEAEDVMQEIFLQIWREAERYDPARASVQAWLFTIARSRSLDRYRNRRTALERFNDYSTEDLDAVSGSDDPEAAGVIRHYVRSALQSLPGEQRRVLELSYYQGLTQEEIAAALGEPLGTVKSRIRSALMKLRTIFSSEATTDV